MLETHRHELIIKDSILSEPLISGSKFVNVVPQRMWQFASIFRSSSSSSSETSSSEAFHYESLVSISIDVGLCSDFDMPSFEFCVGS